MPADSSSLIEILRAEVAIDSTIPPLICTGIIGRAGTLAEVRHQLERWATGTNLPALLVADLVLSSYEALVNAAEHAYPSGPGPVDIVAARTTDGRVLVTVRDHGRWRPPPTESGVRGRGLLMIRALTHRVEVRKSPGGTTVHMEWEPSATGYGSTTT